MVVDPNSAGQCVLRVESLPIKSGEDARRLPLFGAVSTNLDELGNFWFKIGLSRLLCFYSILPISVLV